jgi:hypothetical protein
MEDDEEGLLGEVEVWAPRQDPWALADRLSALLPRFPVLAKS